MARFVRNVFLFCVFSISYHRFMALGNVKAEGRNATACLRQELLPATGLFKRLDVLKLAVGGR